MELTNRILNNAEYRSHLADIEKAEKDRIFCRHGIDHCLDVARIASLINEEQGLGLSKDLIYAAALLHDIGRAEEYAGGRCHDLAGVSIAEIVLVKEHAAKDQIKMITKAIEGHRGQGRENILPEDGEAMRLSKVIKEADKRSRSCFSCKAYNECKWPEEKKNKEILY